MLVELRDQTEQYLRWRFQGTLDEARRLFSSRKFKADIDRMEWGEEHVAPGETCAWTSSCKTQYANDPREGGMANFLRAHISVSPILEKAQRLGFRVHVYDEGGFWKKRDVKALAENVGQWDQSLAALFGAVKDADSACDSAMSGRPDFERLEALAHGGLGKLAGKIGDHLPGKDCPIDSQGAFDCLKIHSRMEGME